MNTYWTVDDLRKLENIWIHQMAGDLKYLCCLSCQSAIIGYQIISQPDQIYISCDRVKAELEVDGEMQDGMGMDDQGQYQEEYGVPDGYG